MILPQKKSLIFFAVCMGIFFVGLLSLLVFQGRPRPIQPGTAPTIVPTIPIETQSGIRIVSTNPTQNELVPIATNEILYSFSKEIAGKAARVTLFEEITGVNVSVNPVTEGNVLKVSILRPLAPDSHYTATLKLLDGSVFSHTLTFRTRPGEPIDTYPIGLPEKIEELDRQNNPDIFVANKLPFKNSTFSISNTIQSNGKITFIVKGNATEAKNWLLSLGLTEAQIASLSIQYTQ